MLCWTKLELMHIVPEPIPVDILVPLPLSDSSVAKQKDAMRCLSNHCALCSEGFTALGLSD